MLFPPDGKPGIRTSEPADPLPPRIIGNAHISIYDPGSYSNHEPTRTRRLLMHKAEIRKLEIRLNQSGLTMVPLSLYFLRGKVKVELAVVKGRKTFDKRDKLDERRARKEIRGIMRGERPE